MRTDKRNADTPAALLTPAAVVALLGVSPRTLMRMADDGRVEAIKLPGSGHRRYRRESVEAILEGRA